MKKIFLGLGSDTGDRLEHLSEALGLITETVGKIISISSVYETDPWGFKGDRKFLNMAVEVETDLSPSALLTTILATETRMGRLRNSTRYGSRIIDIDILLYGDEIINESDIFIPHPHLHERRFVLVPLNEIASGLIHPVKNAKIHKLLEECTDNGSVTFFQLPLNTG